MKKLERIENTTVENMTEYYIRLALDYILLALIMLIFAIVSFNNIRPLPIWVDYAFTVAAIIGFIVALIGCLVMLYKRYALIYYK